MRDETKYHCLVPFGAVLPTVRRRVRHELGRAGLARKKVLAAVVQLLDETAIRIGNEEYARQNRSFGLTTLEHEHARRVGEQLCG
jgi:DNA topoisomerase-1